MQLACRRCRALGRKTAISGGKSRQMHKITCLPDKTQLSIGEGETILAASLRAGVPHAHACGGRAHCSTCRIWVLEGLEHCSERSELERAIASGLAEITGALRTLSCHVFAPFALIFSVRVHAQVGESQLEL